MKVEGNNGMEKGIKDEQKGKERIMVGGVIGHRKVKVHIHV